MPTIRESLLLMAAVVLLTSAEEQTCSSLTAYATNKGNITSPNYPSNYDNNLDLCWVLKSDEDGNKVRLRIQDFQTESCTSCSCAYLEIRDGSDSNSPLIGERYCGDIDIPDVTSTGDAIYVQFRTESTDTYRGFQIEYQSIGNLTCTSLTAYDSESGNFTSPNYPANYDNYDMLCWVIMPLLSGHQVQLRFLDFKTEKTKDYVEIKDGSSSNSPLIGKYSGHTDVPNVDSTGDSIYVYFRADSSSTDSGFQIEYQAIGGLTCTSLTAYTTNTTSFASPNYPSDYDNYHMVCWVITSFLSGHQVQLRVLDFKTESKRDYVEIRDGRSSDSPLIGNYSGDINVPDANSTGKSIYVYFRTDSSTTDRGFKIEYNTIVQNPAHSIPQNTAAKVGQSARLGCSTNLCCEFRDVTTWVMGKEASGLDNFIYRHTVDGTGMQEGYEGAADNSRRHADDLIIKNASADTAGFYSCIFVRGGQQTRYSALFNAMESPQCTSTHNSFPEISGTVLDCSVAYWGPMKPRLSWKLGNLEVYGKVVEDSDDYTTPPAAGERRFLKTVLGNFTMEIFPDEFEVTCVVRFDAKEQGCSAVETGPMPSYTDSCTMAFQTENQWSLE